MRLGRAIVVLTVLGMTGGMGYAVTPAEKCVLAKQKAATKKATAKLKCWGKAIIARAASVDPICLTTAETRFEAAISKAEATGACLLTGQAAAIESAVDTFVDSMVALTPSLCGPGSGGFRFAGTCWYLGQGSCDSVCSGRGFTCDETATRDVAGSGGTLAYCGVIIDTLVPSTAPNQQLDADITVSCPDPDMGTGCSYSPSRAFPPFPPDPPLPPRALRITAPPTTCAADGAGGFCFSETLRACACQ